MRYSSVTSTLSVGRIAEGVVLGRWLREPDITAITAQVARFQCLGNVLLDNDGTAGGVDEP